MRTLAKSHALILTCASSGQPFHPPTGVGGYTGLVYLASGIASTPLVLDKRSSAKRPFVHGAGAKILSDHAIKRALPC